jgi:hypothetical protein
MGMSFQDAANVLPAIPVRPKCPLFQEAMKRFHSGQMTSDQAWEWLKSHPDYEGPSCYPDTCPKCLEKTASTKDHPHAD